MPSTLIPVLPRRVNTSKTLWSFIPLLCLGGAVLAQVAPDLAHAVNWPSVVLSLGLGVLGLLGTILPIRLRQAHERRLAELRHLEVLARLAHLDECQDVAEASRRDARVGRHLAEGLYLERAARVPELGEWIRRAEQERDDGPPIDPRGY